MGKYFAVRFSDDAGRDKVWRAITEDLQRHVPVGSSVLDCGTGYGSFINNIKAKQKFAIDLAPESKRHLAKNVKFFVASITKIPLKAASVDVVFASNLFEHLTHEEVSLAIKEVRRVLKPRGKIILLQPNWAYAYRQYFDDYTHRSVFSHVSLPDRLAAEGLIPVVVHKKYLPLTMKSRLPKSYWMTKLYLLLPVRPKAGQMLVVAQRANGRDM